MTNARPLIRETIGNATLYLGDCREALPMLSGVDAVVTDPPYPDYHVAIFRSDSFDARVLDSFGCHQFIFWSPRAEFPLTHSAIHIWHKTGTGDIASYERIFERNGWHSCRVFTGNPITNPTMARFARDEWTPHPSQKPTSLLVQLIGETVGETILDPFMGSGTTGVACARLGRRFIGIECHEPYFDIAVRRITEAQRQGDLLRDMPQAEDPADARMADMFAGDAA